MNTMDKAALIAAALDWAQTKLGDPGYAGRCYAFCEDAYELGGGIILDGQGTTAWEAACAYQARDRTRGIPPRGAYVFYECYGPLKGEAPQKVRNWGHVGLSLGDGRVIHAWNVVRMDGYLDIPRLDPAPGWSPAVYAGWAPPEVFLRGARPAVGGA